MDRDLVQRLKVVDESQGLPVLFQYAEPAGSVGGVRRFIHTTRDLVLNDADDLVEHSGRYRIVPQGPRNVFDGGYEDRIEVFVVETSFLHFVPGEGVFLHPNDVMSKPYLVLP